MADYPEIIIRYRCSVCGYLNHSRNTVYICPICGYQSADIFPGKQWQAGSSGLRTFGCPNCGAELE